MSKQSKWSEQRALCSSVEATDRCSRHGLSGLVCFSFLTRMIGGKWQQPVSIKSSEVGVRLVYSCCSTQLKARVSVVCTTECVWVCAGQGRRVADPDCLVLPSCVQAPSRLMMFLCFPMIFIISISEIRSDRSFSVASAVGINHIRAISQCSVGEKKEKDPSQ